MYNALSTLFDYASILVSLSLAFFFTAHIMQSPVFTIGSMRARPALAYLATTYSAYIFSLTPVTEIMYLLNGNP